MTGASGCSPWGGSTRSKSALPGITFTKELLEASATPESRRELCEKTGISVSLILEWANHCDLMRIPSIGPEEADVLEEIGVDTIPELAQRNSENLFEAYQEYVKKFEGKWVPDQETVNKWVLYAENRILFPRILEY